MPETTAVPERVGVLESQMRDTRSDIHSIFDKIDDLQNRLVTRPSWAVTLALTVLSSLCVGLAVALATSVGH